MKDLEIEILEIFPDIHSISIYIYIIYFIILYVIIFYYIIFYYILLYCEQSQSERINFYI